MRFVLAALAVTAAPALAEEPPVPQLLRGLGTEKGQWRMELLQAEGRGRSIRGGTASVVLCTDNLLREARERSARRARPDCKFRLLKDTPDEMLMETECPDSASRISMKREGAKSVLMNGEVKDSRGTSTMTMRYTYEGACAEGGSAMRFDKDSDACRQMRGQLAGLDPAKACANAGEQRAECEARARTAAEQIAAMCR